MMRSLRVRLHATDAWTLMFDPYYRNRRLLLHLLPQMLANRLGLHRPYGRLRCALGIYPKPFHHLPGATFPCGWCGRHHGRRWPSPRDQERSISP